MKTATVRDLRNNFTRVSGWIANGEAVEITKGGKPFARLVPTSSGQQRKLVKVDFATQIRKTWGNRKFNATQVAAMRAAELAGEEG
jgi:antitoxin (DNA-binding transcriptional repressor) of toxin-antitoxin stability system